MGFGYIAPASAERVNQFYTAFLNPYVNFHRPSAQPEQYLRQGRTLAALRRAAGALSDTEAALRLQRARDARFASLELAA